ncbi:MAG TPA: NAD(P)H-binding protein, partial [Vicinamibacteria bacterium]|nr:NAD(P)H-binding protein [Vicinamibacteria bacterium]
MRVVLFGATGMVGQGVLRECLLDPDVESVVAVGRRANGQIHPKLRELVHKDLLDLAPLESELTGLDAAFFCLGITSAGMTEADYTRVTYDITMAAAASLVRLSPALTFVFVSGAGADSSEQGRTMWARVKGKTENALLRMPFRAVYVLRPAVIQPLHGITSRTGSYRVFYAIARPLFPV